MQRRHDEELTALIEQFSEAEAGGSAASSSASPISSTATKTQSRELSPQDKELKDVVRRTETLQKELLEAYTQRRDMEAEIRVLKARVSVPQTPSLFCNLPAASRFNALFEIADRDFGKDG